jgi:heme/copper-type cytochrome/quinol oxidase subunit 1
VLFLLPAHSASYGWFAYAPLSDTTFQPPGIWLTPQGQAGVVWFIVGLALLAFGFGWALGRRHAPDPRRPPTPSSPGT